MLPGDVLGVCPRSAKVADVDDEFTLYAVTTMRKVSEEFNMKCREHKWIPRDFEYSADGKEEEKKELERTQQQERKVWGEVLRLARTGWGEAVMIWIHTLCLRVFVETVLRYGLPLEFVAALIKVSSHAPQRLWMTTILTKLQTTPKLAKKAKQALDSEYSYLGGNAFGRDKKGRVTKDDSALSSEMGAAGVGGEGSEYTAYAYYEFQIV